MKSPATNPFAAASEEFFPGGQRKRLFDQLRHLSQWSRRALLVTGALGSGKTMLHTHLARALGKDASAAALNGAQIANQHELFVQLSAQLGIDHANDAATELISDLLRGYVQTQNDLERLCVILVDDAQELDPGAMEALLSLSADCRVRLIFFGETSLTKLVDKATLNLEIACHETPLLALSAADSRGYIEWRAKQLGYHRMPFNEEQLATLYSASDGIPGRIDVLASQLLQDMAETGASSPQSRPGLLPVREFPLSNLWIALALAGVLGLAYFWLDRSSPDATSSTEAVAAEAPAGDLSAAEDSAIREAAAAAALAEQQAAERAAAAEKAAADQAAAELLKAEQLAAEKLAAEQAQAEAAQVAAEKAAAEAAAAEKAAAEKAAAEKVAAEKAVADSAAAQAQRSSAGNASAELAAAVPGVRDSRWLLQQDGNHYTVQLITLGNRDGMIRYLRSHAGPERFALYTRVADQQTLYVVTFGSYPDRDAAATAARSLPKSVGNIKPWIRPFREVQQTIRTAN
ncbi:MAG: AAA family ATPase [Pseudomonadales bacterium]